MCRHPLELEVKYSFLYQPVLRSVTMQVQSYFLQLLQSSSVFDGRSKCWGSVLTCRKDHYVYPTNASPHSQPNSQSRAVSSGAKNVPQLPIEIINMISGAYLEPFTLIPREKPRHIPNDWNLVHHSELLALVSDFDFAQGRNRLPARAIAQLLQLRLVNTSFHDAFWLAVKASFDGQIRLRHRFSSWLQSSEHDSSSWLRPLINSITLETLPPLDSSPLALSRTHELLDKAAPNLRNIYIRYAGRVPQLCQDEPPFEAALGGDFDKQYVNDVQSLLEQSLGQSVLTALSEKDITINVAYSPFSGLDEDEDFVIRMEVKNLYEICVVERTVGLFWGSNDR